jgi:ATP-dependent DNA helicase DinG
VRQPVDAILGPGGALAQALPGYEHRAEQLTMAHAVELAILDGRALLAEAGTGTGKTLAYLVPALQSGKKVVISTGTKHLQEQIIGKDVPLLSEALGKPVEAVVLKGISNYLCRRKLAELGLVADPELVQIGNWARRTSTGDRAELAEVPDDSPAWKAVTTTPDARLGPRCEHFERCYVTQARRAAAKAAIVIVNHHLYFADAALRAAYPGAAVLPEHDVVVFDEAHQIEDVATEHFGLVVSSLRLAVLGRDAHAELTFRARRSGAELRSAALLLQNLEQRAESFFALVRARLGPEDVRTVWPDDLFHDPLRREAWFKLDAALDELAAHADRRAADLADEAGDEAEAGKIGEALHGIARRARGIRDDLGELADSGPSAARRLVRWTERRGRAVFLGASPIDVAPLLREHVIKGVATAVFASATLTAGGRFDYARERLGLPLEDADEVLVDSPFDYARQAMLYLPRDLPLPGDPGFGEAALRRVRELCAITAGRAFVLFTSHRALKSAAIALRQDFPYPVLVQGEAPRPILVERFRSTPNAVLLATSSFWEGVDVPGDALSLVIIEKLPFAAPDDPITAARTGRLEEAGLDAFGAYQLPRAAIALKQGFGRLIRRKDDRGIVAILDHRIVTRAYGATFLASLPRAARTSALEQVRRWWTDGGSLRP